MKNDIPLYLKYLSHAPDGWPEKISYAFQVDPTGHIILTVVTLLMTIFCIALVPRYYKKMSDYGAQMNAAAFALISLFLPLFVIVYFMVDIKGLGVYQSAPYRLVSTDVDYSKSTISHDEPVVTARLTDGRTEFQVTAENGDRLTEGWYRIQTDKHVLTRSSALERTLDKESPVTLIPVKGSGG